MPSESITKRQTFWRDHVLAAAAHEGSIVEYAKVHSLKTKDIYQWKTSLTKRGLLPVGTAPASNDFIAVQSVDLVEAYDQAEMACRLTLACGTVIEFFAPLDSTVLPKLLSAIQRN
ncbi:MAG: hypothetical protein V3U65_05390 [Granulosicoccaceae bacterium]